MLAQLPTESIHPLVQVILGGSALVFLLNQGITFWKDHMREQPTPADTYTTKAEHQDLADAMVERYGELRDALKHCASKEQVAELKKEIDKVDHERRTGIAGLHKRIEDTERRLDARIDSVPERTINLLKDTKGLIR